MATLKLSDGRSVRETFEWTERGRVSKAIKIARTVIGRIGEVYVRARRR